MMCSSRKLFGSCFFQRLGLRGGLDVDLAAGQARGEAGVLALLADGERQLIVRHDDAAGLCALLQLRDEKFNRPVICFIDTPGAYCGLGAEERGQGEAIAKKSLQNGGSVSSTLRSFRILFLFCSSW